MRSGSGPNCTPKGSCPGAPRRTGASAIWSNTWPSRSTPCHDIQTPAQEEHLTRLWRALRFEPCAPSCANWLRYGIQPKNPRAGLRPGCCRGKTHRRETLGFGGRRVLVSRNGRVRPSPTIERTDANGSANSSVCPMTLPARATCGSPRRSATPMFFPESRLLLAIADRARWRDELERAQDAARRDSDHAVSATGLGRQRDVLGAPRGHNREL
jgi:replication initiator protein RepSA